MDLSWLKWGNLVIDTGREFYIPWRLLSGEMLYRDIAFIHGPFSPYLNAFLCRVLGVHIFSFILSGIITIAVLCVIIYKISRIFLSVSFSTLCVITFLFVFAFGHYYEAGIFNYIIPHSYPAIHSITLAMAALVFYYSALTRKKKRYLYLCSFFTMLTLITRVDIGAILIASIFLGIFFDFRNQHGFRKRLRAIGIHCIFPVLIAGLIYGFFAVITKSSASQSVVIGKDVFLQGLSILRSFEGNLLGLHDLSNNIRRISIIILYYSGVTVVVFIVGWILSRVRESQSVKKNLIAVGAAFFIAGIAILIQRSFLPHHMQYRCVPLIAILLCIIAYRRYLRGVERERFLFLAVFSIFSVLVLTRVLFNVWAGHYGYYLLVPGMLCYYFFFLKIIPELSSRKEVQGLCRFVFVAISISFIITHAAISSYAYEKRTMEISAPRGTMRVFPSYYRYKELLAYIRENTEPSSSIVVFPQGLTLNFLSERESPIDHYCYSFLPDDFINPVFEKRLLEELQNNNVTYVVILRRDTSEYGAGRFGIDYAQGTTQYLASHYAIEKQFGPLPFTTDKFTAILLKKR